MCVLSGLSFSHTRASLWEETHGYPQNKPSIMALPLLKILWWYYGYLRTKHNREANTGCVFAREQVRLSAQTVTLLPHLLEHWWVHVMNLIYYVTQDIWGELSYPCTLLAPPLHSQLILMQPAVWSSTLGRRPTVLHQTGSTAVLRSEVFGFRRAWQRDVPPQPAGINQWGLN